jgi:ElaB/YqjD/DUF883 family membrane-anchored ribosome-binding protein
MTQPPDKPTGAASDLDTDSLPWQPSPGPLTADDVADGPEEAISGGSHQASGEAVRTSASEAAAELAASAPGSAAPIAEELKDAIGAEPLKAVGIAAMIGFLAAAILWR